MKFRGYSFIIAGICIAVFLLQIFFSGFTDYFVLNEQAYTQIWRFVTAIFLHGSLSHILYNMFALILFGSILEKLIGGRRFLAVFFVTGILANLFSVNFYDSSLGASGAIFGVIGTLIIVRPSLTVFAFGLPMPIFIAGVLWVAGDVIGVFVPSGTANIAHLSGIFFGLVLGAFYRDWSQRREGGQRIAFDEDSVRQWEDRYL